MLRVLWATKRAYWTSAAASRRAIRDEQIVPKKVRRLLTPARLDVLHLLKLHGSMSQKAMRLALGVVKSTLSELLSTMERLGLLCRGRRLRRGRTVSATVEGDKAYDFAITIQEHLDVTISRTFASDSIELAYEQGCYEFLPIPTD